MKQNALEVILGFVILCITVYFITLTYLNTQAQRTLHTYTLYAKFHDVGNIQNGADVRISGVRIGEITDHYIDKKSYQAVLVMHINRSVKIPQDSLAIIISNNFLGNIYLKIQPGISVNMLKNNNYFHYVKNFVSLEEMIGKFMFSL